MLAASYSELGQACFGTVGKYIVDFLFVSYLFGALVGYIEILGTSLTPFINMIPNFHMDKMYFYFYYFFL